MGSQRNNEGIFNLTILFLCSAILNATLIFPGVSSLGCDAEDALIDEIDFGIPCNETHNTCKNYHGTVACANASQEENGKPSKICDCIWNHKYSGKFVLNENKTRCVGLVYSSCSTSEEDDPQITCVNDAYCNTKHDVKKHRKNGSFAVSARKFSEFDGGTPPPRYAPGKNNGTCSCPENSSPNDDWDHCFINFNEDCSREVDKCNPHKGTVSCQQVEGRKFCDCNLNFVKEEYFFNYTLFNDTCVGLVNSPCGKIGDDEVGCVNGAIKTPNFADPTTSICACDIFHIATPDRHCANNKYSIIVPVPTEIAYGTACLKEPIEVEKCKKYDHDQVACVNRHLKGFKSNRCDCKGNDNIPLEVQGKYVWDNDTESCLGYVRSPCNPKQTHNCIENAKCGRDYSGQTVCLCVSGYEEHFDRVCNVTSKIVNPAETPKQIIPTPFKVFQPFIPLHYLQFFRFTFYF